MPTKGTLPSVESTSRDYFSLAGFEVAIIGRFWVATEDRSASQNIRMVAGIGFMAADLTA